MPKRERWTEADVVALPSGEHDWFELKSGLLLQGSGWRDDLAKPIGAMANSGDGSLLLGVEDDRTLTGVSEQHKGQHRTREWLEQVVPTLLSYQLEDFRVHEVEHDSPSAIPAGKVLIVIDVGDSALAPHQTSASKTYFCRQGGHSVPAPHFYVETLRSRLTSPSLKAALAGVLLRQAYLHGDCVVAELTFRFSVENSGRVAAYKWALVIESAEGRDGREDDYLPPDKYPKGGMRESSISLDDTILPGLRRNHDWECGLRLQFVSKRSDVDGEVRALLAPLTITYRVVSETSRGESTTTAAINAANVDALVADIWDAVKPAST